MKNSTQKTIILIISGIIFLACKNPFFPDKREITYDRISESGINQEVKYYIVTFDADGGAPAPGMQKIIEGEKVAKVPAMSKDYFGFGGWYKDTLLNNEWNFATDMVQSDLTLHAKWGSLFHTVTFDANGGNPIPAQQNVIEGAKIIEPAALRQSGLGFGGWYTDPACTNPWNFATDTMEHSDITLYAKWDISHCTVTFQANGGIPAPRDQDLINGANVVEPLAMSREGYGFGGWYTDPGLTRQWNFISDVVASSNFTLYAKWVLNYHTVRFYPNDGRAPMMLSVPYGSTLYKPVGMINPNNAFLGWYIAPDLVYEWDFDMDLVTKDLELHALWVTADYHVTFWSARSGGTILEQQGIAPGGKASEYPPIQRSGYGFFGWFTDGGAQWDFDNVVTMSFNLYPKWVPNNYPDAVWVPKSSFIMGDDKTTGALPAHKVTLTKGFYMNKYPVTQGEYRAITMTNPSNFHAGAEADNHPVEKVSWYDAIKYCNLRSMTEGLMPVYTINGSTDPNSAAWGTTPTTNSPAWNAAIMNPDVNGYRLPTEAEWEFAARGGHGSPGNYIYSGSNDPNAVAWYNTTTNNSGTRPVYTLMPNGLGIYHMSGNVSEWCWDWYDANYYFVSPEKDPEGPPGPVGTLLRVRRGGSWNNAVGNIRVVIRNSFAPDKGEWVNGFRVIRGLKAGETPAD